MLISSETCIIFSLSANFAVATILIYIYSDIAFANGKEVILESPAFAENDRTYTPIGFISETLGAKVEWIEVKQKIVITKKTNYASI